MCDEERVNIGKGDEEMATQTIEITSTINNEQAKRIINSPRYKKKNVEVVHDFEMSKKERNSLLRNILDSNK